MDTDELIAAIAEKHGTTLAAIKGRLRERPVMLARCEAIRAVLASRPEMSRPQLGRVFHRDQSTLTYHINHDCSCDKHQNINPNVTVAR